MALVEADRRPRPRDGSHQREPNAPLRHPSAAVGPQAGRALSNSRDHVARGPSVRGRLRRDARRSGPSRRDSDSRRGRRSAGRALRTGLRLGRRSQEHLRDRVLPHAPHGREGRALALGSADHGGVRTARGSGVRARGKRVRRGSRDPVAAGRDGAPGRRGGFGIRGAIGDRRGRNVPGARVHGARRALLAAPTRAASGAGSPAAPRAPISSGPRSSRSRSKRRMWSTR